MIRASLGNIDLLKLPKTAFLCSRKTPATAVLPAYDWAISQRDSGLCVISGFHSPLEKDVLHFLLKGSQPIILALARALKVKPEKQFSQAFSEGRLLVISPFENQKRVSEQSAQIRNQMMISLADSIVVGYAKTGGNLEKLLRKSEKTTIYLQT